MHFNTITTDSIKLLERKISFNLNTNRKSKFEITNNDENNLKYICLDIEYLDRYNKPIKIGFIETILFNLDSVSNDNINLEEFFMNRENNIYDIYSVIINNFNKDYYKYFKDETLGNILNVIDLTLNNEFNNKEVFLFVMNNLPFYIYKVTCLKVGTILTYKNNKSFNFDKDLLDIYTQMGYLEVDNSSDFMAKNIDIRYEAHEKSNKAKDNEFFINFKEVLNNKSLVEKLIQHKTIHFME